MGRRAVTWWDFGVAVFLSWMDFCFFLTSGKATFENENCQSIRSSGHTREDALRSLRNQALRDE